MSRKYLTLLLFCLWITGLMAVGCTYRNNSQPNLVKAYRQKMEIRQAALAKEEIQAPTSELDAEGHEKLGDLHLQQGKKELAFLRYDKALRMDPSRIHIRYHLGCLFLQKGLYEEARKEFQEMLKINPRDALPYEGMGRLYFQSGNLPEAEKSFQQAIRFDPGFWQAHHFLGLIYDRHHQFDRALDEYRKAIALKPNSFMLYHNLGMSLFLSGNYEQAVTAFTRALNLEPTNRRGLNNGALALSKLGKYDEALEMLKKGWEEASAYNLLGCIYMMEGKVEEAIGAFEKAIDIKPVFYAAAHKNLMRARSTLIAFPVREGAEQTEDKR